MGCDFYRARTRGRARTLWPGYTGLYEESLGLSVTRVPELDGPGPEGELPMVRVACPPGVAACPSCAEWGVHLDFPASVAYVRDRDTKAGSSV